MASLSVKKSNVTVLDLTSSASHRSSLAVKHPTAPTTHESVSSNPPAPNRPNVTVLDINRANSYRDSKLGLNSGNIAPDRPNPLNVHTSAPARSNVTVVDVTKGAAIASKPSATVSSSQIPHKPYASSFAVTVGGVQKSPVHNPYSDFPVRELDPAALRNLDSDVVSSSTRYEFTIEDLGRTYPNPYRPKHFETRSEGPYRRTVRAGVNHKAHLIASAFFPPWIIVWFFLTVYQDCNSCMSKGKG